MILDDFEYPCTDERINFMTNFLHNNNYCYHWKLIRITLVDEFIYLPWSFT